MAIPAIPTNLYVQTANSQVYLSWDLISGATSYSVQRSTDGVTFTTVSSPSVPNYLDTSVTIGTQYFYQVASTNTSGTSPYTPSQSAVPVPTGEMSLGQLRLNSQQRADRVNSEFVTLPEWNSYINQSLFELYDLLITAYEEYYVASPAQFTTDGSSQVFPLPDGSTSFINSLTGQSFVAPPFYKLKGVDLGVSNANTGWVTINKFNFIDRNKYFYPNTQSTIYGVFNMSYRMLGNNIEFIPLPSSNQNIRLWYIPRMVMLLKDTDITSQSVSGWIEYVIVDAAIKALQKEESDTSVLQMQKEALIKRIEASARNRDQGMPDTISDTRSLGSWGNNGGPMGGYPGGF